MALMRVCSFLKLLNILWRFILSGLPESKMLLFELSLLEQLSNLSFHFVSNCTFLCYSSM